MPSDAVKSDTPTIHNRWTLQQERRRRELKAAMRELVLVVFDEVTKEAPAQGRVGL